MTRNEDKNPPNENLIALKLVLRNIYIIITNNSNWFDNDIYTRNITFTFYALVDDGHLIFKIYHFDKAKTNINFFFFVRLNGFIL